MSEAITLPRDDFRVLGATQRLIASDQSISLHLASDLRPMASSLRRLAQRENMGTALPTPVEELIAGSTLVKQGAEGVCSLDPRRR
jgi:hypothetical protein